MVAPSSLSRHLLLGGQRSGKSRYAEALAVAWCARSGLHRATVIATAQVHDDEMRLRVDRHRSDRHQALNTAEVPNGLGAFIAEHTAPEHLLVVDCLTLWVAQSLMPYSPTPPGASEAGWARERDALFVALASSAGPLVFISNEIGMGVMPLGRDVRYCIDEIGRLHQSLAQHCDLVTLMVAGLPLSIKSPERTTHA